MADLINPSRMRRVADKGETLVQEFFISSAPARFTLVASMAGDPIFTLKEIVGSRNGPREELAADELDQLPPALRKKLKKEGFSPDVEFGRVGPGAPLALAKGDRVRGVIECVVPETQSEGTVFATLQIDGLGARVDVPFALTIGKVQVNLLARPVVGRRGQTVQVPVQVVFPGGTPAADITFELRGEHTRIDPQLLSVPQGGSAVANLSLVTDRDAPLGTLKDQLLTTTGFDGPGLEDNLMFDIDIAEPARVKADLVARQRSAPRGGKFHFEIAFTPDPGFDTTVVITHASGLPPGVRLNAPVTAQVRGKTIVTVELTVDRQAAPADDVPGALHWTTSDGTSSGRLPIQLSIDKLEVRRKVGVNFRLSEIHCVDEGDGPGTAEPYLWVLFFKIDGETVSMGSATNLQGHVFTQRMPPGHGNLGSRDVDAGDTVPIPGHLGVWNTNLVPIPIVDDEARALVKSVKGWDDVPGSLGVLVTLIEEDSLPDDAATAGYNAMVRAFETELNGIIPTLSALKPDLDSDFEQQIKAAVSAAVEKTVKHVLDFPAQVAAWIAGPDQFLGSAAVRVNHDLLVERRAITFEHRWKEGVNVNVPLDKDLLLDGPGRLITNGGEWILKGSITAT